MPREEYGIQTPRNDYTRSPAPYTVHTAHTEERINDYEQLTAEAYANGLSPLRISTYFDKNFFHERSIWFALRHQIPVNEDQARTYIEFAFNHQASHVLTHTMQAHPMKTADPWWNIIGHPIACGSDMSYIRSEYTSLYQKRGETLPRLIQGAAMLRDTLPEPIQDRCHRSRLIKALPPHLHVQASKAGPTDEDVLRACLPAEINSSYIPRETIYSHDPRIRHAGLPPRVYETNPMTGERCERPTTQGTGIRGSLIGPNLETLSTTRQHSKKCYRCGLVGHLSNQGCDHPEASTDQDFLLVPARPRST